MRVPPQKLVHISTRRFAEMLAWCETVFVLRLLPQR